MTQMNCFLLSGGLFQIYSNPIEYFISYEDISNKALRMYSNESPNIVSIFGKYYNIVILSKSEQSNIEKINIDFLNEINRDSSKPFSLLFEDIKNHFETIVLNYFELFIEKFRKVYFYYENLLFLLIDYNIFKLLGIDMSQINFTLNIDLFINKEGLSP